VRGHLPATVPLPKGRGLSSGVEWVSSYDEHEGLKAAIGGRPFRGASWQGCQVHHLRNLTKLVVSGAKRKELATGLGGVFAAPTKEASLKLGKQLADRWRGKGYEKVAEHLEENTEDCLACLLAFPEGHRRQCIRTTNGAGEAKSGNERLTQVVRIFSRTAGHAYVW
jgi:transposase-like protein